MRIALLLFSLILGGIGLGLAVQTGQELPRRFSAGPNLLRMLIQGSGSPTVVFESFGPAPLEMWSRVQKAVAPFARTVSYDHGGYGGSEPGPAPRDAEQIARELRAALRAADAPPPYLLVGYSMGGPYARVFASLHPDEVAGLVLVDPTQEAFMDWLAIHFPEANQISQRHRNAQDEIGSAPFSLEQARTNRLPNIPITLITGIKPHDPFTRRYLPEWRHAHEDWLEQFPQARHVVTTNSGHNVLFNEPDLVIEAIRTTRDRILD